MVTYAERPWVKNYDAGVPATIDYPDKTLHDFLRESAQKAPNKVALITSAALPSAAKPLLGRKVNTMTFAELDRASDALAAGLVAMGVKKGDRVAIVMPNSVAFVTSFYAILKAGGVVAATNPTYPADKMKFQIDDSGAEVVLCLTMFYDLVNSIRSETKVKKVITANIKEYLPGLAKFLFTIAKEKKEGHRVESLQPGDRWFQDVLAEFDGQKPDIELTPDDMCLFQYTGGTTGISKAAMSAHKGLVANMLQMDAILSAQLAPPEGDVFLGAIPMFHVFGMVAVLSFAVYKQAPIALVPNARDIFDVLGAIKKFQTTIFFGVPALFNAINNHDLVKSGKVSLQSLRLCVSGSAPLPPSTKNEFERLSGSVLLEGFGMSEAPTATHVNPVIGENRTGSIGMPLPDVDIRIVSLDDGKTDLGVGEVGELVIAGPNIMLGYHGMPTETANVLREKDGKRWLHTGDIARMDEDGYCYIVDRKKDMALIGGFNVYPNAVEKVLKSHSAVLEVAVAAIPHPEKEGQEALKAWIVLQPDAEVTEEALVDHCKDKLAGYEVPRRFRFVAELPKTAIGKTLRRELIRQEMEEREKAGK
jgi:long-chain acyl-CoA synthetase